MVIYINFKLSNTTQESPQDRKLSTTYTTPSHLKYLKHPISFSPRTNPYQTNTKPHFQLSIQKPKNHLNLKSISPTPHHYTTSHIPYTHPPTLTPLTPLLSPPQHTIQPPFPHLTHLPLLLLQYPFHFSTLTIQHIFPHYIHYPPSHLKTSPISSHPHRIITPSPILLTQHPSHFHLPSTNNLPSTFPDSLTSLIITTKTP